MELLKKIKTEKESPEKRDEYLWKAAKALLKKNGKPCRGNKGPPFF
jgi:hypothetical protein